MPITRLDSCDAAMRVRERSAPGSAPLVHSRRGVTGAGMGPIEPLIDLRNVTLRYGPVTALDDVSLCVAPGRVGLLGPNGAGKSSLLKLLMGLIPPTAGSGTVLGYQLDSA